MRIKKLTSELSTSPQIATTDMDAIVKAGFKSLLSNRRDGEAEDQPLFTEVEMAAKAAGLETRHVPVDPANITDADVAAFAKALSELPAPTLAFCGTGSRVTKLWALSQASHRPIDETMTSASAAGYDLSDIRERLESASGKTSTPVAHHHVLIVGGGSSGIATAASLLNRDNSLDIAIVEPSDTHDYQPGWTMVGAGVFEPEETRRDEASLIPSGVKRYKAAVAAFQPDAGTITLDDGRSLGYDRLVVAAGLKLNWAGIHGLEETLGKNGVTSNYRYDLAPYTWKLAQEFKRGTAIFTQPAMPIKCAGAPQKAMYLSCDHWRGEGVLKDIDVKFMNAGGVLFGVKEYVPALMEYVERYGIDLQFTRNLVAIDGPSKTAIFRTVGGDDDGAEETVGFDMIHVVPPQTAPDFIANSPLAGEAGWVEVDPATLRHTRYDNVFGLGDCTNTTNAKTAAAARAQAPVVANNVLVSLDRAKGWASYDGYGSCPLTVEKGKIVLAEFGYGGKVQPSFPHWFNDGFKPTRRAWFLKARMLPWIYWNGMLKGREWMVKPVVGA